MIDASPPLDYAAASRPRRRARRIIFASLLLVSVVLAWRCWRPIANRATLLAAQRRCLTDALPAAHVVYDSVAARLAVSGNTIGRYRQFIDDGLQCWLTTPPLDGRYYQSTAWSDLRSAMGGQVDSREAATVYVHERRAAGREPRLIVVELVNADMDFRTRVIVPAGPLRGPTVGPPRDVSTSLSKLHAVGRPYVPASGQDVRVFAGQSDPADESRFTVEANVEGVSLVFTGRLLADDTVQIELPDNVDR